jgi:O-antigen/teichoic acid export membrane protein
LLRRDADRLDNGGIELGVLKNFIRGTSVTLIAGGISSVIAAIYLVLAIRSLSTAEFGVASVLVSFGGLLGGTLNFGDTLQQVRRIAGLSPDEGRRVLAKNILTRSAIAVIVVILGCAVAVLGVGSLAIVTAILGAAFFVNSGSQVFLLGNQKFASAALIPIFEKTLTLGLTFTSFAFGTFSVETLPIAQASSLVVTAVIAVLVSRVPKFHWAARPSFRELTQFWRGSTSLGISSLAPTLMQLDVPIVNGLAGSHQAALFAVGSRLVSPLSLVGNALSTVLLPVFSGRELLRPGRKTLLMLTTTVLGVLTVLVVLVLSAVWWVPLLFGDSYVGAVIPVQFYIVSVAAGLFARPAATILQAQGSDKLVAIAVSTQILSALAILAVGSQIAGAAGAALGLSSTNLVLAVYLWIIIVRKLGKEGQV